MKSILDSSFRYTPSVSTDLKKTFARIRKMQREAEAEREAAANEPTKIVSIPTRKIVKP